jgi:nitroreductase
LRFSGSKEGSDVIPGSRSSAVLDPLFPPVPIEEKKLEQVLEAGRLAPSACNLQPWVFIVVRKSEARRKLQSAYSRDWLATAPAIIAVCCEPEAAWVRSSDGKRHGDIDAAIAVDHMTLCAADLGLGTCWICAFDPARAREALELPPHLEPVALLPIGYPAAGGMPKERKPLAELVRYEKFSP